MCEPHGGVVMPDAFGLMGGNIAEEVAEEGHVKTLLVPPQHDKLQI